MDAQAATKITVTARCLCGAHVYTTPVLVSALPLRAVCCHCDSCRRMTGGLYFAETTWPPCIDGASADGGVDLSGLRRYDFSDKIHVFSCATCSSFLFCRGARGEDRLSVMVSALEDAAVPGGPPVVVYDAHIFVGDTLDGGASTLLCHVSDSSGGERAMVTSRWRGRNDGSSDELGLDWPGAEDWPDWAAKTEGGCGAGATQLRCVCGGVDLVVRSRASDGALAAAEPGSSRYRADFCACGLCRRFFGADLTARAWVPLLHIELAGDEVGSSGDAFPRDLAGLRAAVCDGRLGTLRCYKSSPHMERYFCSTCSASVFLADDGERPGVVGVGVGLLQHAPDGSGGALSEGFLAWDKGGGIGGVEDMRVGGGWRWGLLSAAVEGGEWAAWSRR